MRYYLMPNDLMSSIESHYIERFYNGKIKILNLNEEELNSYYDINNLNNGGGYHQPHITGEIIVGRDLMAIEIIDTSCGDFGQRWEASMYINGIKASYVEVNTMDDCETIIETLGNLKVFVSIYNAIMHIIGHTKYQVAL